MNRQVLFVKMTIRDGDNYIAARRPNEDNKMRITIKNKYKISHMLTLQEAEDFAEFLIDHVKNRRLLNSIANSACDCNNFAEYDNGINWCSACGRKLS